MDKEPTQAKNFNINIDYIVFSYALQSTKLRNIKDAQKDLKFLKDTDKDRDFWFTSVFNRSIGENILYTSALSLFDNSHDILSFDRLDSRVFKLSEEKSAFAFFERMKNLFMPSKIAQFVYRGTAQPQLYIDELLVRWSQGLKDLIK